MEYPSRRRRRGGLRNHRGRAKAQCCLSPSWRCEGRNGQWLCKGRPSDAPARLSQAIRNSSPPRPSRRSPKGGAAHPQRTFCLSFFWFSVSSKGASSSIMSPQRSFPGITRRRCLPLDTAAKSTYGERQCEMKRRQGSAWPKPCVTSATRTAKLGKVIPDILDLNSLLATQSLANECKRSRFAHPCSKVIGCYN